MAIDAGSRRRALADYGRRQDRASQRDEAVSDRNWPRVLLVLAAIAAAVGVWLILPVARIG